jgi:hypothetical protein
MKSPPNAMAGSKRPTRPRDADIELVASVEADELRFDEPPETEVRFFGEPGHESASGSDRTNLPEEVEPGVTYRNVRIDYRLATRLVEAPSRARKRARGLWPSGRRA